jgi:hypothetical protein
VLIDKDEKLIAISREAPCTGTYNDIQSRQTQKAGKRNLHQRIRNENVQLLHFLWHFRPIIIVPDLFVGHCLQ